ncbi:MAG: hypothetical protein K0R54_3791 [Clostridiaceae bacterium]|nr:hypothetical protein [Clostridiaceae bacterium]
MSVIVQHKNKSKDEILYTIVCTIIAVLLVLIVALEFRQSYTIVKLSNENQQLKQKVQSQSKIISTYEDQLSIYENQVSKYRQSISIILTKYIQ